MAKKKKGAGRTALLVFLGLGGAVAAGLGLWLTSDVSRAKQEQAAAARNPPTMPTGRLQLVSVTSEAATYLALDGIRKAGGTATATILRVGKTVDSIKGGGAMASQEATVDCAAGRVFDGKVGTFDVDGKLTGAAVGYSGKRGRPAEPGDYQVPALCNGETGRVVEGFRAAQREVQALPDGWQKRAEADPKDADAWGWLCAAGTRNRWRPQTPADCGRAIELLPDDAAMRLNRAYVFMKVGRNAEAAADFAKVIAADPKNATALYGRSLMTGIKSGVAASRADRCAALALDKRVADWVAQTYQIQMSREYRAC